MEKCLFTKLKGSVNNNNLELFGYIRIKVLAGGDAVLYISMDSDVTVKTSNNVKLVVSGVEYDTYTYESGNFVSITARSKDSNDGFIFLDGKYSANKYLNITSDNAYSIIDFVDVKFLTSLTTLSGVKAQGELSNLSSLINISQLSFPNNNDDIYGDISSLSGLTSLVNLRMYSRNVTGELKNIANLANIKLVDVRSSNVFGSIEDFANLLAPNKNNEDVVTVFCSDHITYNGAFVGNTHSAIITFNGSGGYNVVVQ